MMSLCVWGGVLKLLDTHDLGFGGCGRIDKNFGWSMVAGGGM
jgi:hypothetical protein